MLGKKRAKGRKLRIGKLFRIILAMGLLLAGVLVVVVFFNPWVWRLDLQAELEKSKIASTIYDREGEPVATMYAKTRLWIPAEEIPDQLKKAFVITEDKRFYEHKGIDVRGILRAVYHDIKVGEKVQGGSTITQQLVKNLFFTQEKLFIRKIWEMAYAIRVEQQYSKEQILEFYLNSLYLGHGTWGIAGGAQMCFGKSVAELTLGESAVLAGMAKSPEYYSPFRNPDASETRRNLVLKLMYEQGELELGEYETALSEEIVTLAKPGNVYVGAWFADYVMTVLTRETELSEDQLRSGGYRIYTTMDRQAQAVAETVFDTLPEGTADKWGVMQPQGALVAIKPQTGEILAMVGGRRFSAAESNRSFQIHRQPGSAVKPFVFAAALEAGYSSETYIEDQPLEIDVNGKIWRPQNNADEYQGWITLRTALEESVNTIAVQLVQSVGVPKVYEMAKRLGIESLVETGTVNDLSLAPLALGGYTKGVTLLELTAAYSAFANQGMRLLPFGIVRVYDSRGRLVYQNEGVQEQVLAPEIAGELSSMMAGVITRGTGIGVGTVGQASGKTGTTNRNTNGWFVGYNDKVLAGVWIGNDRSSSPLLVNGVPLGSGKAAAIWGEFLRKSGLITELPEQNW